MNVDIQENTRLASGTITLNGRKSDYTAIVNRNDSPGAGWWIVDLIVYNKTFGGIEYSIQRTYNFDECRLLGRAIKAALLELKQDNPNPGKRA